MASGSEVDSKLQQTNGKATGSGQCAGSCVPVPVPVCVRERAGDDSVPSPCVVFLSLSLF